MLFAGNSGRREDGEPLVDAGLGYPALITLEPDGVARHAGRHRILAPPGFPVAALHVERLVPAGEGVLLGYDRTTGAWFRLALEAGPDVP